jgi:starch synthase (maltosyl-transferring)
MNSAFSQTGRTRAVIERVSPEVDNGRFPVKRTVDEDVIVEADIFVDGQDQLHCLLLYRPVGSQPWVEVSMIPVSKDRWQARFLVDTVGRYEYTVMASVDHFLTWRHDLAQREETDDILIALQVGAELVSAAAKRSSGDDSRELQNWVTKLRSTVTPKAGRAIAESEGLANLMAANGERLFITKYCRVLEVVVDVERARFSSWYELFPRSCPAGDKVHGNFTQLIERLPYIASMGFDVLYLPPIHPIGHTFRKGPNNSLSTSSDDPGSPWAIGAIEGGHCDIHPELGSVKDFRRLIVRARELGIEVALDLAFHCSPDHPYVEQHPEWFRHRPDGSIQYAENPPKKYQDIYPFNFESDQWEELWHELRSVVDHWIGEGVYIFRVDNPHTKPFPFWEWLIRGVKAEHPKVIFLAEAFTRPKVMHRLAKLGFTQSYTYFTWRNTKQELTNYFTELAHHDSREYFRPNLWPNTPDILSEFLQYGGRPAFLLRAALAATLGASYGIYGPAFELMEHEAREPGSEEPLNSEKYQLRHWDLDQPDSLRDYIACLNRIRHDNPALQSDWSLRFHMVDNPLMLCYSKLAGGNALVMVANLEPHKVQSGWIELPLADLGVLPDLPYEAHDLLSGARFEWQGRRNFVRLYPRAAPIQILSLHNTSQANTISIVPPELRV